MQRSLLTFILLIFFSNPSFSQQPDTSWTAVFGGLSHDYARWMTKTEDGALAITGSTLSYSQNNNYEVYLHKINTDGDSVWTSFYGDYLNEHGENVQLTSDDGFILSASVFGQFDTDTWMIKTDSDGDTTWTRIWEHGGEGFCETQDGGYLSVTGNMKVYKYDSDGDSVWSRDWYNGEDFVSRFQLTPDGGCVVAGNSYWSMVEPYWVHVSKLDSLGYIDWTFNLWENTENEAGTRDIKRTSDGGYIICGSVDAQDGMEWDIYLLKLTADGDFDWCRKYGGEQNESGRCVTETTQGNLMVTGYSKSHGDPEGDVIVLKTDSEGNEIWTFTEGGEGYDRGECIVQLDDGRYVILSTSDSGWRGNEDAWLICLYDDESLVDESGGFYMPEKVEINVFPNPSNGFVTVNLGDTGYRNITSKLFNSLGREVAFFSNIINSGSSGRFSIGTDDLSSGTYYLLIYGDQEFIGSEKVILLK